MITLQADFNHMDASGRLRLAALRMHQHTPFAEIAAKHEPIIFVDGDDMVRGELVHDPEHGWIGHVDWSTQDVWESYPPAVAARGGSPCVVVTGAWRALGSGTAQANRSTRGFQMTPKDAEAADAVPREAKP